MNCGTHDHFGCSIVISVRWRTLASMSMNHASLSGGTTTRRSTPAYASENRRRASRSERRRPRPCLIQILRALASLAGCVQCTNFCETIEIGKVQAPVAFSSENLLTELDQPRIIDWAVELKNRKDAFAFLMEAVRGDQLNLN